MVHRRTRFTFVATNKGDIDHQFTTRPMNVCCCLYDASTLKPLGVVNVAFPDTVAIIDKWLVAGTEAGVIAVYDISNPGNAVLVASMNLRSVTGHTGIEDIEIRALWAEPAAGGLGIYAVSSWGSSNMPVAERNALPTFFVLAFK